MINKVLRAILYTIIFIGLFVGYIKYLESRSIFFPTKEIEFIPQLINFYFEDVYIETEDRIKIHGWFVPQKNARYTILFLHGNAGNIGHRLDKVEILAKRGLNLLIVDYRGYGKSQGRPSEYGLYLDAKAAYSYLVNNRKIKPGQIILYGESLGCAVVVDLASKVKSKGLILEGAFSSGRDMAKIIYPFLPAFVFSKKFDSLTKIQKVEAPKLFIHSQNDEMVPFDLAKKLYNVAKEPKRMVMLKGGHNTAFLDSKETYTFALTSFIKELETGS